MSEYTTYIGNLAKDGLNIVFSNTGEENAATVIKSVFENAKVKIKLFFSFSINFITQDKDFSEAVKKFFARDGRLVITVQDNTGTDQLVSEIKSLFAYYLLIYPNKTEVKKSDGDSLIKDKLNFAVGDENMYFVQEELEDVSTSGNFFDLETSKKLSDLFDKISGDASNKIKIK